MVKGSSLTSDQLDSINNFWADKKTPTQDVGASNEVAEDIKGEGDS